MNLQKILWNEAHWNINKAIAKEVWIEWALILSHLIEFQNHFEKKWKLVKTKSWDWFFSQTEKQIENQTFVSRRWQDKAIKILKEKWFLEQVLAWNPARKHFKINSEKILNFLVNSEKEEIEEKEENSLPNKFAQNEQTEENDKQNCTENPNKFAQNEQAIYKEKEKEINKKYNNTNVLLWAEAQKDFSSYNISKKEKIENLYEELEKKELKKESLKSSAAALSDPTTDTATVVPEVTEEVIYWNKEINDILAFLKKVIWVSDFKESQKMQRIMGKNIFLLWQKIGKEEFVFRLNAILRDGFKAKNTNSLSYLHKELKAFIHSPMLEPELQNKRKITFSW